MNKLTPEMRAALKSSDGPPRYEDEESHKIYLLIEPGNPITLPDDYIQAEVQKGIDAAERGEISELNVEDIKAEGRRRLANRTQEG